MNFQGKHDVGELSLPNMFRFMEQIVQGNPKYQEALQGDERFQALLENYGKNLQQSVSQEQNKMIGRIGVQPVNQQ
ncbi:MAG: hypothetical protein HN607_15325 [Verrucomicrobia bacterium]|jgi:hypothetical protein|nr:hypothetical protein [Verrucomicrobiota bacterium]